MNSPRPRTYRITQIDGTSFYARVCVNGTIEAVSEEHLCWAIGKDWDRMRDAWSTQGCATDLHSPNIEVTT